jgi:TPR repeat protein
MSAPLTQKDKVERKARAKWLLANATTSEDLLELGQTLMRGKYLTYDVSKAYDCICQSHEMGNSKGSIALSSFYSLGMNGIPIDLKRAYELVQPPAADGNATAMAIMDVLHNKLNPKEGEEDT